ncbi:MAG TPA: hypothetical protein VKZ98_02175 [Aquaticitalea sp.]|nr:hypothetical protein [Aquaticitalea sp.]
MKILKHTHRLATFAVASLMLFSCSSEDDSIDGPIGEVVPPIILDCSYFDENPNVHLTDDPNAPVDYIINCDPKINGDFTIDAGVVIEFESNAGLILGKEANGKIQMNGTAEKPIILTGIQKDKGSWRGIQNSSDNPANQMNYVTVEYAGQTGRGGWALQGSVICTSGGVMKINHCTIQHGNLIGLHWLWDAGKLTLSNSTFTGNDIPIQTSVNHINTIDGSSTYTGNVNDYIQLIYTDTYQDVTFHKTDIPFLSDGFKPDNEATRRFTFEPGATLLMEAGSQIRFQNAFHFNHEIIMVGTAQNPITIKGKEDVPGYWEGLQIDYTTNPLNEIAFLDIANAGATNGYPNGAIRLRSSDVFLNMHDVNFIDCFEYAVSVESASAINFSYYNLNLVNTPKMFSDFNGTEIEIP